MKFEHDTVLQEYGVDRKPDIRQFHKLPGIHKEPTEKLPVVSLNENNSTLLKPHGENMITY